MRILRPAISTSAFVLLISSASAQDTLQTYRGPVGTKLHGLYFAPIGDINGDGIEDLIVHVRGRQYPNLGVRAISGLDGSLIWDAHGPGRVYYFGSILSGGEDLNGDGVPDVAVGVPGHYGVPRSYRRELVGRVIVYSGVDGAVLYTLDGEIAYENFGSSVSRIADLDGDGVEDLLVGSFYFNIFHESRKPSRVSVFSGRDGRLIHRVFSDVDDFAFGGSVVSLGDLDGDGLPEFATTSNIGYDDLSPSDEVLAFSGADASLIRTWRESTADFVVRPGLMDNAGDLNGDGISDVVMGGKCVDLSGDEAVYSPCVIAYSGADSSTLWRRVGDSDIAYFGARGVGDVNRDDIPDIMVGLTNSQTNRMGYSMWLSGRGGQLLYRFEGTEEDQLGFDVEAMGDVNNDGFADAAFSLPGRRRGAIRVVSGAEYFLSAKPKNPAVGDVLELTLSQSAPGALTVLVIHELDGVQIDRAILGVVAADAEGLRTVTSTIPPELQGRQLGLRAFAVSGGALLATTTEFVTIQ